MKHLAAYCATVTLMNRNGACLRKNKVSDMNGVAKYYDLMESQLQIAKSDDRKKIPEMLASLGLSREEEWVEWDVAMQEHEATYDMLFVNFLRYSCIALLFLA
jgi:hypothetical protein